MATEDQLRLEDIQIDTDGSIHVPAHVLPLSSALSEQSRTYLAAALSRKPRMLIPRPESFASDAEFKIAVDAFRNDVDQAFAGQITERLLKAHPVNMVQKTIAGIPVEEFTPIDSFDESSVLINLHGGAFYSGANTVSRIESIPMAHLGKMRVISVDYRQGYEHKFPAASEDVVAVYSELLKSYPANRIGIYGGSAGGVLTAQATAWILEHGLPVPGAIGIFGAGAGGRGDSDYFASFGIGQWPREGLLGKLTSASVGYFSNARDDDYLVHPNIAPLEFRAKFPPTLLVTGTRAFDMSPAIATHRALVQAGVDASLHVFDGLGHCFYYDPALPEGADAYQTMVRFFSKHLAAK